MRAFIAFLSLSLAVAIHAAPKPEIKLIPRPEIPAAYVKKATWPETVLASRAALKATALSPDEQRKIAKVIGSAVADDFPIQWDWALQDYGLDFVKWFTTDGQTEFEKKMIGHVLEELAAKGADSKAEFDRLVQANAPADDARWLNLYVKSCEQRRAIRLKPVLEKAPKIVFTKHHTIRPSFFAYTEGQSDAQAERHFLPGTSLCLLEMDGLYGKVKTLLADPTGSIRDPAVSYDAGRILFGWKKSLNEDDYHLYEMELASGRTRQITFGLGFADYEPSYLPNDDIVFSSSRCVQTVDCFSTEVSNLYTCDKDGRYLRRLGFDQVHTVYPTVTDDGRVLYTRWDYNDRGQVFPQPLFQMNPDGTAQQSVYGINSWFPTTIDHARGIPGSQKIVAIFCGHHSPQTGKLGLLDPSKGREENTGAQLIAPARETKAEHIDSYGQQGELFQYPYPLSETEFLVTYSPTGWSPKEEIRRMRSPEGNVVADFGIYFMTIDGRRELLVSDPEIPCNQPFPLVARPKPNVRPSSVNYAKNTGTFYMQDVYVGPGLEGVARGTIKKLRVVALDFRAAVIGGNGSGGPGGGAFISTPIAIGNGTWDVKVVLGDAKVYDDGSAFFTAPARTPLYFQALDEKNRVVQTMRSWSTLQPGENQACVGCHENKNTTPPPRYANTQAIKAGPQTLAPFYGSPRGFSFAKEIQPILDRKCVSCHNDRDAVLKTFAGETKKNTTPAAAAPNKAFSLLGDSIEDPDAKRKWSDAYLMLTQSYPDEKKKKEGDKAKTKESETQCNCHRFRGLTDGRLVNWIGSQSVVNMLPPYFAGSTKSELISMLEKGHKNVKLTAEEMDKLVCWIDLLVPFSGDYKEANAWNEKELEKYDRYYEKRRRMEAIERANIAELMARQSGQAKDLAVRVELRDATGKIVAQQQAATCAAALTLERDYQPGDKIVVTGPKQMAIRLDDAMAESLVYAPNGCVEFPVPTGKERGVYSPESFKGAKHIIAARPATREEMSGYRNLAVNPYDLRGESTMYPHATSNSECRGEAAFAARNAIDGSSINTRHGGWPNQSWGPDKRTDLWWKLDFGRPVELDKLVLYVRADFPHDSIWQSATVEFSDGSHEAITIKKTAEKQVFTFTKRTVSWVRLTNLVQPEPLQWCAWTELQAYGTDVAAVAELK